MVVGTGLRQKAERSSNRDVTSRHVTSPLLVPLRATAPSCALSANGAKPYPVYFSRTSRSSGQRQRTIKHEGQCQGCSKCSKQQWGQCSGGVSHHRDAAKPSPHCRLHGSFPSGNGTTLGRCEGPDWALLRPRRGATLLSAHPSGLSRELGPHLRHTPPPRPQPVPLGVWDLGFAAPHKVTASATGEGTT